jgi:hypothetical protein
MPAPKTKPTPLAQMVDEAADLENELAPYVPKAARLETLRKAIRAHYESAAAEQEHIAQGVKYVALLGAKESKASSGAPDSHHHAQGPRRVPVRDPAGRDAHSFRQPISRIPAQGGIMTATAPPTLHERVARLETRADNADQAIKEIKADLKAILYSTIGTLVAAVAALLKLLHG